MVSKTDLNAKIDDNLQTAITISCDMDGTYSEDVNDYACTRPCPFPQLPEPEIMVHDWVLNDTKPEIFQEVRCLFTND